MASYLYLRRFISSIVVLILVILDAEARIVLKPVFVHLMRY